MFWRGPREVTSWTSRMTPWSVRAEWFASQASVGIVVDREWEYVDEVFVRYLWLSLSLFSHKRKFIDPPLRSCKNVCVLKNGKRCEVSIRHNWHSRTFLFYIQDVFHESKSHKNNMSYWYYAEKKVEFDILVIWSSQLYSFIVSKRKRGERSKQTSVTPCQLDPMPDFVRT